MKNFEKVLVVPYIYMILKTWNQVNWMSYDSFINFTNWSSYVVIVTDFAIKWILCLMAKFSL